MRAARKLRAALRCLLWAAGAALLAGCATNPVTKQQEFVLMSEQQELAVGREMDPAIRKQYGEYASESLQQYVSAVGRRVAGVSDRADIFFHFTVLDSPVVNAFALPGGYIYVTRGLLAHINSEAELAGVLGHETGHVTARHAVQQYTKAASYQIGAGIASVVAPGLARNFGQFGDLVFAAISSGYSREYETQADSLAVSYAARAGYDPRAVSSLLKTLDLLDRQRSGGKTYTSLFATHPATEKRIADIEQAEGITPGRALTVNREAYLQHMDGLAYGDDVEKGVVSGSRFRHPGLRIEAVFPQGWEITNRDDAVTAADPGSRFLIELRAYTLGKKMPVEQAAAGIARGIGLKLISGARDSINGLTAFVGSYGGTSSSLGPVVARAGFCMVRDRVFYIIGYAPTPQFSAASPFFERAIRSLRQLSPAEAAGIRPVRIRLHRVREGETLAGILKGYSRPAEETKTVALLNAWDPGRPAPLSPGMVIKVLRTE